MLIFLPYVKYLQWMSDLKVKEDIKMRSNIYEQEV